MEAVTWANRGLVVATDGAPDWQGSRHRGKIVGDVNMMEDSPMTARLIELGERGALELPDEVREKYGLKSGDTVSLIDLEGVLVLSPRNSKVSRLAAEIDSSRRADGLSVEELMEGMEGQRRRYTKEQYGTPHS